MRYLKLFLSVLVLGCLSLLPSSSQDYSSLSDTELIQNLETQLKRQETLCNQQQERLQLLEAQLKNQSEYVASLETQYKSQMEYVKTLNNQIASLQIQLQLAGDYYRNSKNEKIRDNIIVGITSFSAGFFSGTVNQMLRK